MEVIENKGQIDWLRKELDEKDPQIAVLMIENNEAQSRAEKDYGLATESIKMRIEGLEKALKTARRHSRHSKAVPRRRNRRHAGKWTLEQKWTNLEAGAQVRNGVAHYQGSCYYISPRFETGATSVAENGSTSSSRKRVGEGAGAGGGTMQ